MKYAIKRSLFMDDYLYTISDAVVKANDLYSISEISKLDLGYEEGGGVVYREQVGL